MGVCVCVCVCVCVIASACDYECSYVQAYMRRCVCVYELIECACVPPIVYVVWHYQYYTSVHVDMCMCVCVYKYPKSLHPFSSSSLCSYRYVASILSGISYKAIA